MKKSKKLLLIALGVITLLVAVIGIYAVSRRTAFNNNEILLGFEQNDPTVYTSEKTGITYYEYDCDHGRVIFQYEPQVVTVVRDDKRGFVKEYRDNILRSVIDLRAKRYLISFVMNTGGQILSVQTRKWPALSSYWQMVTIQRFCLAMTEKSLQQQAGQFMFRETGATFRSHRAGRRRRTIS